MENYNIQKQVQAYIFLPKEQRQAALQKVERAAESDVRYFELLDALVKAESAIEPARPAHQAQVPEFDLDKVVSKFIIPSAKIIALGYVLYFVGGVVVSFTSAAVGFIATWGGWAIGGGAVALLLSNVSFKRRKVGGTSERWERERFYERESYERTTDNN